MIEGYCWPLSASPGETIEFKVSTSEEFFRMTLVRFRSRAVDAATPDDIVNKRELDDVALAPPIDLPGVKQANPNPEDLGCPHWVTSYRLSIPEDWDSDIYAARCVELPQVVGAPPGEPFYIVFIVKPKAGANRNCRLLVMANVSTWNAYNLWGGHDRYSFADASDVAPHPLSYQRPHINTVNRKREVTVDDTRFRARGESWVLNWLRGRGFPFDVCTDLDIHAGVPPLGQYAAIVLSTHPEYATTTVYDRIAGYLDDGGSLVYLGGNGLYDAVDVSADGRVMIVHGSYTRRPNLFRNLGRPEIALFGIHFPRVNGGDAGNVGSDTTPSRPYLVNGEAKSHPFLAGVEGDIVGTTGWNFGRLNPDVALGFANPFEAAAASGTEVDIVEGSSPTVLASGQNPTFGERFGAQMVTFTHAGGGTVFSVGSMQFGGSLVRDKNLQTIVANVLDQCILNCMKGVNTRRESPVERIIPPTDPWLHVYGSIWINVLTGHIVTRPTAPPGPVPEHVLYSPGRGSDLLTDSLRTLQRVLSDHGSEGRREALVRMDAVSEGMDLLRRALRALFEEKG
jgi:N,N-dimethylformamidase beta subunit-like, C-terminal